MSKRVTRWGCASVSMFCVAASFAGCGVSESSRSQTPRIEERAASELTSSLLTTADLRSVPGLPRDVEAVSLDVVGLYENPDPRGPCGAKIHTPAPSRSRGVGLRSQQDFGWEFVFGLSLAEAKAYVGSVIADTRAGCPEHRSTTNTGSVQRVRLERIVDVGAVGDEQVASTFALTNNGHTMRGAQITIRKANRVAEVVFFTPFSDNVLRAVAARAAARL